MTTSSVPGAPGTDSHNCHRTMAAELFNRTWELLDMGDRTPADDREMLGAAYASRYHWRMVGDARNQSVSDWQMSRVWAVLGDASRAADHGRLALQIAEVDDVGPFYVGYGHEALARAAQLDGDQVTRDRHLAAARDLLAEVGDTDEAALLRKDLDDIAEA